MYRFKSLILAAAAALTLSAALSAQQVKRADYDVTSYTMDVTLEPAAQRLNATVDVAFTPLEDTRSVAFELNGKLKVESITRPAAASAPIQPQTRPGSRTAPRPAGTPPAGAGLTFTQDQVGVQDLGPSVRVDLGEVVTKGTPVILRFKYSGILENAEGGPLLNKRLAYIGEKEGYLMYAARWFPFHDYAADLATADISLSLPTGYQVIGLNDMGTGGKHRFVQSRPGLVGNIAYGRYQTRNLNFNGFELAFYTLPGNEGRVQKYAETLGRALENYTKRFGQADFGTKLNIVQIDDESLDFYSSTGMLYIASRHFEEERDVTYERLQREAAFQWWGQTVALKSFDDAWLSQGLAEYSAYSLRESQLDGPKLEELRRGLVEKALTFEQTASLLQAPKNLDDQSRAYEYLMYGKGPLAFKLLRDTLGTAKFDTLLRNFLQQYRGKNASIDDFEKLASSVAGTNLRYFFARWVEGTGVPEFESDYQILRTRSGKFVTRGTIKQNFENLRLPIDVMLRSEGSNGEKVETLQMDDASVDFNIESDGKPIAIVVDPGYKLLRISPDLRVSAIARRGIEQFKEGNYVEAQAQFEAALKLDKSNSWVYYHLGLLFLDQRNYDLAIDNFKAALNGTVSPAWLSVWANIKMGNAYDGKGDRTRAVAAYKRAQNDPSNYDNAQEAAKKYLATPFDPREAKNTATK